MSQFVIICHHLLSLVIICDHFQIVIICYPLLSFAIICHHLCSFVIIRHHLSVKMLWRSKVAHSVVRLVELLANCPKATGSIPWKHFGNDASFFARMRNFCLHDAPREVLTSFQSDPVLMQVFHNWAPLWMSIPTSIEKPNGSTFCKQRERLGLWCIYWEAVFKILLQNQILHGCSGIVEQSPGLNVSWYSQQSFVKFSRVIRQFQNCQQMWTKAHEMTICRKIYQKARNVLQFTSAEFQLHSDENGIVLDTYSNLPLESDEHCTFAHEQPLHEARRYTMVRKREEWGSEEWWGSALARIADVRAMTPSDSLT